MISPHDMSADGEHKSPPEILALVFTNDTTLITRNPERIENFKQSSDPVLLLLMDPPSLHPIVNLTHLQIRYTNYDWSPSRIQESVDPLEMGSLTLDSIKVRAPTFIEEVAHYIRSLPADDTMIIVREYQKCIEDGTILDGFVAGVAAYIALLVLSENGAFTKQLPLQFGLPCTVRSGPILTKNMFRYMALPLVALAKTCQGCILGLVTFVQGFINMWDTAFNEGPLIDPHATAMMQLEVTNGISQYTIRTLGSEVHHRQSIEALRKEMKLELSQIRRELQNLLAEARASIAQLNNRFHSVTSDSTGPRHGRSDPSVEPAESFLFESENSHGSIRSSFEPPINGQTFSFELPIDDQTSSFELPMDSGAPPVSSPVSRPYRPWQQRRTPIVAPDMV